MGGGVVEAVGIDAMIRGYSVSIALGLSITLIVAFALLLRFIIAKQVKDREEHMAKWESMITLQSQVVKNNEESSTKLVESSQQQITSIIQQHREETERQFAIQDRQAQSLEKLAHHMATQTQILQQQHLCPKAKERQ